MKRLFSGTRVARHLLKHAHPSATGLFQIPGLHKPADWARVAHACVRDCNRLVDQIRAQRNFPSAHTLQLFDDLSNHICTVLDADFVLAANESYTTVSAVTVGLNSDRSLYEPLEYLHELSTGPNPQLILSEEQAALLKSLKLDFERGGILLSAEDRIPVSNLQNRINFLGSKFSHNSSHSDASFSLERSQLGSVPARIRKHIQHIAPSCGPAGMHLDAGDPEVLSLILKHVRDDRIRRQAFVFQHSRNSEVNLPILDQLISSRHELATQLGFPSYAKMMFQGRLASSPADVTEYLTALCASLRSAVDEENAVLLQSKYLSQNRGFARQSPFALERDPDIMQAWERSHYIGVAKSSCFELDSQEISSHLSLAACLNGIAMVMQRVFGISLGRVARSDCEHELWHGDVEKLELRHNQDGVLGHIYLDLYPRPGKYSHAAHFCVRCGREPSESGAPYQTPIVALVCNFSQTRPDAPPLLSFGDYETLWHEFGHAMHSLLSRTKYQHLSGTRVATDFVEIPSHVFEYFAWDPRVLAEVAKHWRSGAALPTRHVCALAASRYQFFGSELQTQAMYSCLDLQYHSESPPIGRTTEAASLLQNKLTSVPFVVGTAPQASFQHFAGYGAGYYSYVFARLLSAQLWSELFEEDPFSRSAGDILRGRMLSRGAAKEPWQILDDVVQDQPSAEHFLREAWSHRTSRKAAKTLYAPIRGTSKYMQADEEGFRSLLPIQRES